jgi:5'-3' exonuclease
VFDGSEAKRTQQESLKDYKSNRVSQEDHVYESFNACRTCLKHLGYKVIHKKTKEADQTIATLALQHAEDGEDVVIVSNDKDFNQLINDRIKVYDPITKTMRDKQYVIDKFKVTPSQFAFYLTLIGDKVDNVSGLHKCGPVNAVKLVKKYKTFKKAVTLLSESSFALDKFEQMFVDQINHLKNCYKVVKLVKESHINIPDGNKDLATLRKYCEKRGYDYSYLFETTMKF